MDPDSTDSTIPTLCLPPVSLVPSRDFGVRLGAPREKRRVRQRWRKLLPWSEPGSPPIL